MAGRMGKMGDGRARERLSWKLRSEWTSEVTQTGQGLLSLSVLICAPRLGAAADHPRLA